MTDISILLLRSNELARIFFIVFRNLKPSEKLISSKIWIAIITIMKNNEKLVLVPYSLYF